MVPTDGREIVFAGAGILWGATTFVRGLSIWRSDPKKSLSRKSPPPASVIAGFLLILACSGYLAWSFIDIKR